MARISGKSGRVYMAIASAGTPEPLPFVAEWSLQANTDRFEVTAEGDANKVYVSGLPDASGSLSFFYDTATRQTYTAATDGIARGFYLYTDTVGSPNQYFYGTWLIDFNLTVPIGGAASGTASWSAASTITKIG